MDPISIITGVSSICTVCARLILKFSDYVNQVRGAPASVQELSNELSSVYTALSQLKIIIENHTDIAHKTLPAWAKDFAVVIENCGKTFASIEIIVEKSKIKTKEISGGQVLKRIKWVWQENDVVLLRDRLERYKLSMVLILEAATYQHQGSIEEQIRKIHESVEKLHEGRLNVKETLVVLDTDHAAFDTTLLTLTDRRKQINQDPVEALRKETLGLEDKAAALRKVIPEQESKVDALHKEVLDLENKADALREELSKQESKADMLRKETSNEESRVSTLQKEALELQNKTQTLRLEVSREESRLYLLRGESTELQNKTQILRQNISAEESRVSSLRREAMELQDTMRTLRQDFSREESKVITLRREAAEAENRARTIGQPVSREEAAAKELAHKKYW